MSRRSRKRKKSVQSAPRPLVTRQTDREFANFSSRREVLPERRQFEPIKIKEFDDEFTPIRSEEVPSRVGGSHAKIATRISGSALPGDDIHDSMRESPLPALHDYFQERPELVTSCARRRQRRSVLFALRRTNAGSARGKKHIWTETSKIRCV